MSNIVTVQVDRIKGLPFTTFMNHNSPNVVCAHRSTERLWFDSIPVQGFETEESRTQRREYYLCDQGGPSFLVLMA